VFFPIQKTQKEGGDFLVTFFPFCCLFSFVKRLYRLYRLRSKKKLDNIELRRFFWLLFSRFWLLFSRSGYFFPVSGYFFPVLVTFFPFWLHNMKSVAFSYINGYNCIEKAAIFL
jgi:hypothetical protein